VRAGSGQEAQHLCTSFFNKPAVSPERRVRTHLPRRTRQQKHGAEEKSGTFLCQFSHTREIFEHKDRQKEVMPVSKFLKYITYKAKRFNCAKLPLGIPYI